jgi:perosamine synthetase
MKKKLFWRFSGNEKKYIYNIFQRGLRPKKVKSYNNLLENKWSRFHKLKYSITINSCTSALHVALRALELNNEDEVLVPALTPVMCASSIILANLKPIFVDVEPNTFLIDPKDVEKKITSKTKAIILVHMYGGVCNSKVFVRIANKYKIKIIEDCAESLGARDKHGKLCGTIGDIACWSFQQAKHITCGDGGMLSTNNMRLAEKIRKFSNLGFKFLKANADEIIVSKEKLQNPETERFELIGYNYRLNEFSAAIAYAQFERINFFIKKRREVSLKLLKEIKKCKFLTPQKIDKKTFSTFYTLSVRLKTSKVRWKDFRKKFIEFGGDSIYAASKILQDEPSIKYGNIGRCYKNCRNNCLEKCNGTPIAKHLQGQLLNFCTNQGDKKNIDNQVQAIKKTIKYFNAKI